MRSSATILVNRFESRARWCRGAAALGAASERPELLMRSLIFVALAEGIAVLGLIMGIMLWTTKINYK